MLKFYSFSRISSHVEIKALLLWTSHCILHQLLGEANDCRMCRHRQSPIMNTSTSSCLDFGARLAPRRAVPPPAKT